MLPNFEPLSNISRTWDDGYSYEFFPSLLIKQFLLQLLVHIDKNGSDEQILLNQTRRKLGGAEEEER